MKTVKIMAVVLVCFMYACKSEKTASLESEKNWESEKNGKNFNIPEISGNSVNRLKVKAITQSFEKILRIENSSWILSSIFIQTQDGGSLLGFIYPDQNGFWNTYIIKFDEFENVKWSRNISTTYKDVGFFDVVEVEDGYIFTGIIGQVKVCGDQDIFLLKIDKFGNILWSKEIDGLFMYLDFSLFIVKAVDGGYIVGGYTASWPDDPRKYGFYYTSACYIYQFDIFLIKIDDFGNTVWAKVIDTSNTTGLYVDEAFSIIPAQRGDGYILTGRGRGGLFISKLDIYGNVKWMRVFPSYNGGYGEGASITYTTDGGYIVVGTNAESEYLQTDLWGNLWSPVYLRIIKINDLGDVVWSKVVGFSPGSSSLNPIVSKGGGRYIVGSNNFLIEIDEFGEIKNAWKLIDNLYIIRMKTYDNWLFITGSMGLWFSGSYILKTPLDLSGACYKESVSLPIWDGPQGNFIGDYTVLDVQPYVRDFNEFYDSAVQINETVLCSNLSMPKIEVFPSKLTFFVISGVNPSPQTAVVRNVGDANSILKFKISASENFVSTSLTDGILGYGESVSFSVYVSGSSLSPGNYVASLIVSSNYSQSEKIDILIYVVSITDFIDTVIYNIRSCVRDPDCWKSRSNDWNAIEALLINFKKKFNVSELQAMKNKIDNAFMQGKLTCKGYKVLYDDYSTLMRALGYEPEPPSQEFLSLCPQF